MLGLLFLQGYDSEKMIYLFTDFGYQGPYVGELKAMLVDGAGPGQPVIDLMHDAPAFEPRLSAYLLSMLAKRFKPGDACLAVVDPGVGSSIRLPILVEADDITFCGPDNGLFSQVIASASSVSINEILWRPEHLSSSFHGRDLFAPALLKSLKRQELDLKPLARQDVIGSQWPADLEKVIYIDGFGNMVTGLRGTSINTRHKILLLDKQIEHAETFSSRPIGDPFWYINSMGLVEIAVNQGRADHYFRAKLGVELSVIG